MGTLRAVLLDLDDTLTDRVATVRAYAEQHDNPEKDVLGAAAIGMLAIWFRARIPWPDGLEPAQESVTSLEQILTLLDLRRTQRTDERRNA